MRSNCSCVSSRCVSEWTSSASRSRRSSSASSWRSATSFRSTISSYGQQLPARLHDGCLNPEPLPQPLERAGAGLEHLDSPGGAELGERDARELFRSVGEDTDA